MSDEKETLSSNTITPSPPFPPLPPPLRDPPPAYESLLINSLFTPQNRISLPEDPPLTVSSTINHRANTANSLSSQSKGGHTRSLSSSSISSLKGRGWFPFSSTPATSVVAASRKPNNELRTTVVNLMRDLVQEHSSSSRAALGILQSCADACGSHGVSLSAILQDKYIESHSPLYWAIVKRQQPDPPDRDDPNEPELLDALLKQASPLNTDTVAELRQACLATSDHSMFQSLRILPQFTVTAGADKIILGSTLLPDDISVKPGPGNEGAFSVDFQLYQFHKRMMVSREISLEFVARSMSYFSYLFDFPLFYYAIDRIWKFTFMIMSDTAWYGPPPGSWCVSLSLQEFSPPTWFDGSVVLHNSDKPLRLRSRQLMEGPRHDVPATQILIPMSDNPDFATLQYSYVLFLINSFT